jgi:hypothetical protein
MYVRVDNGDGISLGIGTCYGGGDRNRPCGSRLYEFASIHFGFLLCAILSASGVEFRLRLYYLVPNRREVANWTKCRIWSAQPFPARTALCTMGEVALSVPVRREVFADRFDLERNLVAAVRGQRQRYPHVS